MDAGALHTHIYYITMHFLSTKSYVSHQFTELIFRTCLILWLPFGSWLGGAGKGRGKLEQGSHFFTFWDKEADFFSSLN